MTAGIIASFDHQAHHVVAEDLPEGRAARPSTCCASAFGFTARAGRTCRNPVKQVNIKDHWNNNEARN
jgi:hypothetical protein